MTIQHQSLAAGRWQELSFAQQMANIGSEVERAIKWKEKGNHAYCEKATFRFIELIDLTRTSDLSFARQKELARVREAFLEFILGDNPFSSSAQSWRKYFYHFNYLARKDF